MNAAAEALVFRSALGAHLFVTDGSRIYDLPDDEAAHLHAALTRNDAAALAPFSDGPRRIGPHAPAPPPWRAVSLNIAQGCNMGCGYCYADAGTFGGAARMMPAETARRTVRALLDRAAPGERVTIGFMGGEPLLNRPVLRETVETASALAARAGVAVRFSLTTNATLITPDDAALFADHDFTVTVSLDGDATQTAAQRPMKGGANSYARARAGLDHLLARRPASLGARITATAFLDLRRALDHVLSLGFDSAGVAGAFTSPNAALRLHGEALTHYGTELLACGRHALAEALAGRPYPFSNFLLALEELHRGTHRPYPCGAGAAYLSADAEGRLHACHRLIDAPGFDMGDIETGPDDARRQTHLTARHVDRAEPCRSCWARYLCGGGCHQEVAAIGRTHCDLIRDWLAFCLSAYAELSAARPEMFP